MQELINIRFPHHCFKDYKARGQGAVFQARQSVRIPMSYYGLQLADLTMFFIHGPSSMSAPNLVIGLRNTRVPQVRPGHRC